MKFIKNYNLNKGILLLFLILSPSIAQLSGDPSVITQEISDAFNLLNQQINTLNQQSLQITDSVRSTSAYTATLNDAQNTINTISKKSGSKGSILASITYLYKTQTALNSLKVSLNNLSGQINNVKVDILNQINLLNQNSALRNIDSSVALLESLLGAYSSPISVDLAVYKQLCGEYFSFCNNAFVVLAEGLSDYITSIQIASGWSKTEVLTQYVIHNTLLISAMTTLFDLNTQLVIQQLKLNPQTLTDTQKIQYSQSVSLFNSFQRSQERLAIILPQLYDTYYTNLSLQYKTYNDLSLSNNSLVIGLYRTLNGDSVQSITQSKTGQKDVILSKYLIKSEWSNFDNNNTWHSCPANSFLRGFYLNDGGNLHHIEELVCNTFKNTYFDKCNIVEIPGFVATNQWATCDDGYFVTGIYRGNGNTISQITKLNCCSVTSEKPSTLNYLDILTIVNTSYKPQKGIVDLTNGTKGLVQYFTINQGALEGNFQVGVRNGYAVASGTSVADVVTTFDSALNRGSCGQDYFMYGFEQNNGSQFSHIEKLQCVKYQNVYWETCTYQVIPTDSNYWKCRNTSECSTQANPKEARCADGSYLVGLRRNNVNNMYGLDQIVCCTITSTSGQYKTL